MITSPTANEIIDALQLVPLEGEGGFYRETWKLPATEGDRPAATSILYLVTPESFSALHRLDHDEMFHFYMGDPCRQAQVDPDGRMTEITLGHDVLAGAHVQNVVPAGSWQATRLVEGGRFALLGTTNTPGFVPSGFELATLQLLDDLADDVAERVRDLIAVTSHGHVMS